MVKEEKSGVMVSKAIEKMIYFYQGNIHDIEHFLKVWSYAKTIAEREEIDADLQLTLELAAIVHDIACPLCREKYGSADGTLLEKEGVLLVKEFFQEFDITKERLDRICYLVGHHHTFNGIVGSDYQILVEADFLVNASESHIKKNVIQSFGEKVFQTPTGKRLLYEIYR